MTEELILNGILTTARSQYSNFRFPEIIRKWEHWQGMG